jgi:hypothetical protein
MNRLRIILLLLCTTPVIPMGCTKNPDATGEAGIGAPGVPPAQVLSDEEARKIQLKQEEELTKASNKVK